MTSILIKKCVCLQMRSSGPGKREPKRVQTPEERGARAITAKALQIEKVNQTHSFLALLQRRNNHDTWT